MVFVKRDRREPCNNFYFVLLLLVFVLQRNEGSFLCLQLDRDDFCQAFNFYFLDV